MTSGKISLFLAEPLPRAINSAGSTYFYYFCRCNAEPSDTPGRTDEKCQDSDKNTCNIWSCLWKYSVF